MNRIIRQNLNNIHVYNCIVNNNKLNNINDIALNRLLTYTNYNNIYDLLKDKNNYYDIIAKLISLYISKMLASKTI